MASAAAAAAAVAAAATVEITSLLRTMDLKFNTLTTFEVRKLAIHSRNRRELEQLDEKLSSPTSE
jgi:hypothetical protein